MKKILLTTILIILSVLCFGQDPQSIAMSNYYFISSGNWNDGSHWNTGEVPPEGCDVFIAADAVIPAGYTAIANQISLLGGSITVADGGQLKHNTQGLVVTMEKSIAAFNEVNSWSNYYLLAFPFSEDVAVPSTMTANEDNDFYTFDSNYPNAEWRNNKQHVITTVGGTTGYLYANPEAIELSLTGSTYQSYDEAAVSVEVTYSEGSSNIFNGWALLGNPYTCNAYVYALENGSCVPKEFMVYDADGELVRCLCSSVAPMQGFFVKVDETTTICIKTTSPYVDLGLPSGTLWAACNVGAVTPEDYGDYFAWGETQPKDFYDWSTYQHCNGSNNTLTKYCSEANFGYNGFSDTLSILLREDDAATANWGNDWRMPTKEEWQELYNNTTHVWTTQNGVNGRLFTSENGNSLFLPAGGIYSNGSLGSTGSGSYYWSSSLSIESPNLSWQCSFYSNGCNSYEFARFFGLSVRPVSSGIQSTSYLIDATANPTEGGEVSGSGSFIEGTECTLTATANEGYTFTNWTENDEVVSTEAVYIFTVDSDRTLVANFTYNGGGNDHEYVDLGLPSGTLWATCNVGANAPEEYGDYFTWGETQPKDDFTYMWSTYQHCNGSYNTLTKYCNNSDYGYNGFMDNLTVLQPEDDAAMANWGVEWRVPTEAEWEELFNNTTCTWTTQNGINGILFTASNGNSLFLPAAGGRFGSVLDPGGSQGEYWTSSLNTWSTPNKAYGFSFDSYGNYSTWEGENRSCGISIRAVRSTQPITPEYSITITSSPIGGGIVTGGGTYQQGQSCTVSATATSGYTFTNWTENGSVVSTNANYTFTVNSNRTLVANFLAQAPNTYTISVSSNPTNGGSVTGGGTYQQGQSCTVSAIEATGYTFNNWTENGSVVSTNANYTFTVNSNRTLLAHFSMQASNTYTIGVLSNPSNGGTVTGGGIYQQWQICTVNATASTGYVFTNWTENGNVVSTNSNYAFVVNSNRTLVANFSAQAPNTYTISVSSNPANGGSVTGGGTYQQGQSCTVSASANPGHTFIRWMEDGVYVSNDSIYTFTVTNNCALVACFHAESYVISVSANPSIGGNVIGGGSYNHGESCVVHAGVNVGYAFTNWTENDSVVSTNASYTFIVNRNRSLVANYIDNGGGGSHVCVDLGLPSGLLWAACNVGADTPEEYGNYYAWGEKVAKNTYNWSTYKYCEGNYDLLTKYCNDFRYGYNGFIDNLTVLLYSDDVARSNWGDNWRIPTDEEWQELQTNTTREWTTQNGVIGVLYVASNGNSLFLPAAGSRSGNQPYGVGSRCLYWSSSLLPNYYPYKASFFDFVVQWGFDRCYGLSVRPVRSAR